MTEENTEMTEKTTLTFKIHNLDQEAGQVEVEFFDPYGKENLTLAVDLPLEEGKFAGPDALQAHILAVFPVEVFEEQAKRRKAPARSDLTLLIGQTLKGTAPEAPAPEPAYSAFDTRGQALEQARTQEAQDT